MPRRTRLSPLLDAGRQVGLETPQRVDHRRLAGFGRGRYLATGRFSPQLLGQLKPYGDHSRYNPVIRSHGRSQSRVDDLGARSPVQHARDPVIVLGVPAVTAIEALVVKRIHWVTAGLA